MVEIYQFDPDDPFDALLRDHEDAIDGALHDAVDGAPWHGEYVCLAAILPHDGRTFVVAAAQNNAANRAKLLDGCGDDADRAVMAAAFTRDVGAPPDGMQVARVLVVLANNTWRVQLVYFAVAAPDRSMN